MAAKRHLLYLLEMLLRQRQRQRRRRRRKIWVKPWIAKRKERGAYANLLKELKDTSEDFRKFIRMDGAAFNDILKLVENRITKRDTTFRRSIRAEERLAITLRFLATGETFTSLSFQYRVGERTISCIVLETCDAIYNALKERYLKVPSTTEDWQDVAKKFEERWNFPNCLGALDGKHVQIRPPAHSGSTFYNYKHTFSIVLLGLVDADYKFLYVDVGTNGRISDGGVFSQSSLYRALNYKTLNIPEPATLPGDPALKLPYSIVADEAFPLREDLMKPYARRNLSEKETIFNYRLSHTRRVVENAFGILANRFRVLLTPISLSPEKVTNIVLCACVLHNFLRSHRSARHVYSPPDLVDVENPSSHTVIPGTWRSSISLSGGLVGRTTNIIYSAKTMRDCLCDYFHSPAGSVPWQNSMI